MPALIALGRLRLSDGRLQDCRILRRRHEATAARFSWASAIVGAGVVAPPAAKWAGVATTPPVSKSTAPQASSRPSSERSLLLDWSALTFCPWRSSWTKSSIIAIATPLALERDNRWLTSFATSRLTRRTQLRNAHSGAEKVKLEDLRSSLSPRKSTTAEMVPPLSRRGPAPIRGLTTSDGSSIGTKSKNSNCIAKAAAQGACAVAFAEVVLPMPARQAVVTIRLLDKSEGPSQPGRKLATRVAEFRCFQDRAEL